MGYLAAHEKVWGARDRVKTIAGTLSRCPVLRSHPDLPLTPDAPVPGAAGRMQKVLLLVICPVVWRRVLVPSACTLHELRGLTQAAVG